MDGTNGNEVDEKLGASPLPTVVGDKIAILDAGAQYGKVIIDWKMWSVLRVTFHFRTR